MGEKNENPEGQGWWEQGFRLKLMSEYRSGVYFQVESLWVAVVAANGNECSCTLKSHLLGSEVVAALVKN